MPNTHAMFHCRICAKELRIPSSASTGFVLWGRFYLHPDMYPWITRTFGWKQSGISWECDKCQIYLHGIKQFMPTVLPPDEYHVYTMNLSLPLEAFKRKRIQPAAPFEDLAGDPVDLRFRDYLRNKTDKETFGKPCY